MPDIFRFKQFAVNQSGCAMKINTDGVLLAALVKADNPTTILDIGTGTGVIALMLAQTFNNAIIDAVEIDEMAAKAAALNFTNSPFNNRLTISPNSFQDFFDGHRDKKYDLIVSNPPFFLNSLESPKVKTNLAKHTGEAFFEVLITTFQHHLTSKGLAWLVLPLETANLVKDLAGERGLCAHRTVKIHSFSDSEPHREIIALGFEQLDVESCKFVIYEKPKVYSVPYKTLLQPFFIAL